MLQLMKWVHRPVYGMERVHNREPERSQVQPASQSIFYFDTFPFPACESHGSRRRN